MNYRLIKFTFACLVIFSMQTMKSISKEERAESLEDKNKKHLKAMSLNCRYIQYHEINDVQHPELTKFVHKYSFSLKQKNEKKEAQLYLLKQVGKILKREVNNENFGDILNSLHDDEWLLIGSLFKDDKILQNNYFVKGTQIGPDISRIVNAIRMKKIIEKYRLTNLNVADKILDENSIFYLDENQVRIPYLALLVQRIKCCPKRKFSLIDIQQIAKLTEETGFSDWAGNSLDNIIFDENDKIVFIDTEDKSFANPVTGMSAEYENDSLTIKQDKKVSGCRFLYLTHLHRLYPMMETEAQVWYLNRINELINTPEGLDYQPAIYDNTQYDDSEINLQEVKKEWRSLGKSRQDIDELKQK